MNITQIQPIQISPPIQFSLISSSISAGFPSPADDFVDTQLDLNKYLIKHPAATFFVRVSGNSMEKAGIFSEDILIVDRSLDPHNDAIIIAALNGELTVKRLKIVKNRLFLISEKEGYSSVEITEDSDFKVWGVVTSVVHRIK